MLRASWRGFVAHKLRLALTMVAVALGVALMAGTYILTDTINASYGQLVGAAFAGQSVVISPAQPLGAGNGAQISPMTGATVAKVRGVAGVAKAAGQILGSVSILDDKGTPLGTSSADFVTAVVPPPFEVLDAVRGRLPTNAGQVAVDEATVARYGLRLGQPVGVAEAGPVHYYRLVGTVRLAGSSSFAGAGVAVLTMPQAQMVVGEAGHFDEIDVAGRAGTSPSQLRARLASVLPPDVTVRTNSQEVAQLASNFASNIGFFRNFLLIFAYVSLFVGGFIILNTFSVTVAQRTREIGLLRAMGASRRQVRWSVVGESALLGLVGGLAGLGLGTALAPGLDRVFKAFGADLPDNGTILEARTVIVSLVTGVLVSVLAAWAPALRATRVPPMAAIREGTSTGPGRLARHSVMLSAAVFLVGVTMVVTGLAVTGSGALAGVGALVVFVGIALFSPKLIPALSRAIGTVVTWRGVTGALARENARRQPGRTAVTAGALMVGLALVTFVSVLASGAKATIDSSVRAAFAGDLIVEGSSSNNLGIPASVASALKMVPGVAVVAPVDFSEANVRGVAGAQTVTGIDPRALSKMYRVQWEAGGPSALAHLGDRTAVLARSFARAHRFHVGSTVSLLTVSDRHLHLVVSGIASSKAELLGSVTVSRSLVQRDFAQSNDGVDFVGYGPGVNAGGVERAVGRLLAARYPQAESLTTAQFDQQQAGQVNSVLDLVYVLLALAVVVSLFGLVNTLALAVHERKRELGLLRAVGASRRQVRQMVRYESVITALIGAVIGLAVGTLFAATLAQWLVGAGFVMSFPFTTMMLLVLLAALAGILVAALPARRAARLQVLSAIAME